MAPPAGTYNAQVWNQNAPPPNSGDAGFTAVSSTPTNAVSQEIWINTQITDPCAVAQSAAHEIGHGFALDDCDGCPFASTVMVDAQGGYNAANGTYGPTTCDNATVRAAANYHTSQTTEEGGGSGTTRGGNSIEGYYYYECTTYFWVLYWSWDDGQTWVEQNRWEAGCW